MHGQSAMPPVSGQGLEDTSTDSAAAWALAATFQVPSGQLVPVLTDQQGAASVTEGAVGLGVVNIAYVRVTHAVFAGNLPRSTQRPWRRRRAITQADGRASHAPVAHFAGDVIEAPRRLAGDGTEQLTLVRAPPGCL